MHDLHRQLGPLPTEISDVVQAEDLAVVSVLSGNRDFEGRINPDVKMTTWRRRRCASPTRWPGRWTSTSTTSRSAPTTHGNDVFLKDIWPDEAEVAHTVEEAVQSDMFRKSYGEVFDGDERWNSLKVPTGDRFAWDERSTYVRRPPFFDDLPTEPEPLTDITDARVLAARRQRHDRPHLARRVDQA